MVPSFLQYVLNEAALPNPRPGKKDNYRVIPQPALPHGPAIPPEEQDAMFPTGPRPKLLQADYEPDWKDFKKKWKRMGGGKVNKIKVRQPDGSKTKELAFLPKKTLDVPRAEMPQLKNREEFLRWLMNNGVPVKRVMVSARSLWEKNGRRTMAHAQRQMYLKKGFKFIKKNSVLDKDIVLTLDGIIFDGNHHWMSLMYAAPDQPVPMYQVQMNFEPLKQITHQFPGVTFEEHWCDWLESYVPEMVFYEVEEAGDELGWSH